MTSSPPNGTPTPTPATPTTTVSPTTTPTTGNSRPTKKSRHNDVTGPSRKEREEWSEEEISILLDSFTDKYLALDKTSLRWKEWEMVGEDVAEGGVEGDKRKSVEQCKNKIDNLKKRYKVETKRMSESGDVSSWVWFEKMDHVFSDSAYNVMSSAAKGEEGGENGGGGGEDFGDDVSLDSRPALESRPTRRSTRFVFGESD